MRAFWLHAKHATGSFFKNPRRIRGTNRPKEDNMNLAKLVAAFAAVAALAACGGGGGGGSTPPPPPSVCANGATDYPTCTPAPQVTLSTTTPASGATDVATNATVSVAFTTTGTLVAGTANATGTCGATSIAGNASLGASPWTFTPVTSFTAGANCTVAFTGRFRSAGGLETTLSQAITFGVKAADTMYHYGAFNIAVRNDDGNQLYYVDDMGTETKLANGTGYTSATGFALANCALWLNADGTVATLADNRPLASCVTAAPDNTRRNFPVDPNKVLMGEWTGATPAGATLRGGAYGSFGDTPYAAQSIGLKGMYVDVAPSTVLYFTNADGRLRRTADGFATNSVVNQGNHNLIARVQAK